MKRTADLWPKGGGLNLRTGPDMEQARIAIQSHDALVRACESTLESMDIAIGVFGDRIAGSMFKGAFLGVRKQLVTALALAKGGTSE